MLIGYTAVNHSPEQSAVQYNTPPIYQIYTSPPPYTTISYTSVWNTSHRPQSAIDLHQWKTQEESTWYLSPPSCIISVYTFFIYISTLPARNKFSKSGPRSPELISREIFFIVAVFYDRIKGVPYLQYPYVWYQNAGNRIC